MPDGTNDLYSALSIVAKLLDHETPILNRKLPTARIGGGGKITKLPQNVWFESVLYLNENNSLLGHTDRVLTDQQILMNWDNEFGNSRESTGTKVNVGGGLKSGNLSVGSYRSKYRKANLYNQQIKPFLLSLRYDRKGLPIKDRKKKFFYMSLADLRKLCLENCIADPRFFTNEELGKIKDAARKKHELHLWGIPSPTQYKELDKSVVGGIYGAYRVHSKLV